MATSKEQVSLRKVFISYSWTSEDHSAWVADLGERLMADGVDVVLDQWSLKDGQDLNAFMEQMVTDPTMHRVIIVCDAQYAAKADAKKGGVGTESQIISLEVYKRVDQEKFVALVRERDSEGNAFLPVFLRGRKYIDFSNPDIEAGAYEQLIRNIFERPHRPKPALGTPPAHLFEEIAVVISSAHKAKRFRDVVASGKGNASAAFEDFVEDFLMNLEDLRLTYSHEQEGAWCKTLFENIKRGKLYRDVCVDTVLTGISHLHEDWFAASVIAFIERLLPFQQRPKSHEASVEWSEDNYRFFIWELFLYVLASFIKARRYDDARTLFDHRYVSHERLDSSRLKSHSFTEMNDQAGSLEGPCADLGDRRRISTMAHLLHDGADRKDIRFSDIVQADVICWLVGGRGAHYGWHPRTLIYAGGLGVLELFARATSDSGFRPLKILLQFSTPAELIAHLTSEPAGRMWQQEGFWRLDVERLFNLYELRALATN